MKRFSVGWFVGITLLNLIGTAVLGWMGFAAAMSAFGSSGQVSERLDLIKAILWVWATGPMVASHCGLSATHAMLGIIFLWAFVVGTIGGFVVPRISR
jgi:glucose-6-phosphate isomerase